ncbi:MAG: hypothetical protein JST64_12175 [Actinobacteria bacterium]|nr:hypothetical protein [Actinomycetota bacterium]
MARRLTGSIRDLDGRFEASVPERRGARQRVYAYFATRAEAERWCADAVAALYSDDPVPMPAAPASAPPPAASVGDTAGPDRHYFARGARAWHTERYVQMRTAQLEVSMRPPDEGAAVVVDRRISQPSTPESRISTSESDPRQLSSVPGDRSPSMAGEVTDRAMTRSGPAVRA